MKLTIHEARCHVGYCIPVFRGLCREQLLAEIAGVCRKAWEQKSWDGDPPPIPSSDAEVVELYFPEDSETHCEWNTFQLDLAAPDGVVVDLSVDGAPFSVVRRQDTVVSEGVLVQDAGEIGDVLEGFVVALTAAGFPVHLKEFRDCLRGYCENMTNLTT